MNKSACIMIVILAFILTSCSSSKEIKNETARIGDKTLILRYPANQYYPGGALYLYTDDEIEIKVESDQIIGIRKAAGGSNPTYSDEVRCRCSVVLEHRLPMEVDNPYGSDGEPIPVEQFYDQECVVRADNGYIIVSRVGVEPPEQGACDEGMQRVNPNEFSGATKKGKFVVLSYGSKSSPIKRIMQGTTLSVYEDFSVAKLNGKMDLLRSYTRTPTGDVLHNTFLDGETYHSAVRFMEISGDRIEVMNGDEKGKFTFNAGTVFCIAK